MKLQFKINLVSLTILVTVTSALFFSGVITLTHISYDLNYRLMGKEVMNLLATVQESVDILEESGVAEAKSYQQRAKADLLSHFRKYVYGETGRLIILDKTDGRPLLNRPEKHLDNAFLQDLARLESGKTRHFYEGEKRLFTYVTHKPWNWLLVLSESEKTVFEERRNFIKIAVVILLISVGIGAAIFFWATNRIVLPIKKLAKAADTISHGQWDAELPTATGDDEIVDLTESFGTMAENLSETYRNLNENLKEMQKSKDDLATEKERLAVTLRSIGDGVISTDAYGCVTLMNKVAEELTGWSQDEALGQPLDSVFSLQDHGDIQQREGAVPPLLKLIQQGSFEGQFSLQAKDDKHQLAISASGAPIFDANRIALGVILVFRDISEYLQMQEERIKSHKLESVGILAGGIAHDFNNLLTGIVGNLSLAKLAVKPEDSLFKRIDDAEKASKRAKDLTNQLLTFSKGGEPIKKLVNLTKVIKETSSFVLAGSNCKCVHHLEKQLWAVDADEGQISQVIHNLVINGSQAMPAGGDIVVTTENVIIPPNTSLLTKPGANIKISVRDSGCGISAELLPSIFDPYYSTKEKGNGLGLASAYSIINKHSGAIHVKSAIGEGSIFEVYIPAVQQQIEGEEAKEERLEAGGGRVLVLDDEELVRDVTGMMLTSLGYQVDFAEEGAVAIEKYKHAAEQGQNYNLVIMDLTIPGGMGGKEAIMHLREFDPDIVAIVSSGYANDPILANYRDYGFSAIISKPFTMEELSKTLSDMKS